MRLCWLSILVDLLCIHYGVHHANRLPKLVSNQIKPALLKIQMQYSSSYRFLSLSLTADNDLQLRIAVTLFKGVFTEEKFPLLPTHEAIARKTHAVLFAFST
jgi:hypothetical protein